MGLWTNSYWHLAKGGIMNAILGMLAETFIHSGTGYSTGSIDLPVARESTTQFPFIAGSSLKGALLDSETQKGNDEAIRKKIFGEQAHAGSVLFSDVRLLLLPVRSLNATYKWVTCPYVLERLQRDLGRAGHLVDFKISQSLHKGEALSQDKGVLHLEERSFNVIDQPNDDLIISLKTLIKHEVTQARLASQLTLLHDDDFTWFAKYGLAIQARNALDSETKTTKAGALWNEEALPPDTLMYAFLMERQGNSNIFAELKTKDYLQIGGNETVGQGWFSLVWKQSKRSGQE